LREKIYPYLFETDPQPGHSIARKIEHAIRESDAFVVLVTETGQFSKWVNAEIGYAVAAEIPIIALVDKRIPHPDLPFIGDSEYIPVDLNNFETARMTLVQNLKKRKNKKLLFFLGFILLIIGLIYKDKKNTAH